MKRTLIATLALSLMTACAGVAAPAAARSETPQGSLSTTGTEMAKQQSARFDVTGTASLTLPPALVDQLRAKAGSQGALLSSNMTVTFKLTGAAKRPDQLDTTVSATLGGLTINSEVIATGGKLYYKDPMTAKWVAVTRPDPEASGGSTPTLTYQTVLDTAKSVTEVTDPASALSGADHYRIVPDLVKLFAQVQSGSTPKNPQALTAIQNLLQSATVSADVWTGTGDHLVRRLTYDADVTADLSQLASTLGIPAGSSAPGFSVPAGSTAHLTAHAQIDLHDYNGSVTIQAPPTTS